MKTTFPLYQLGKWTLGIVFIGSGLIPLLLSDPVTRLALLNGFPIAQSWHQTVFYTLVCMDVLCGLIIIIYPFRALWLILILVTVIYTIAITIYAPILWRDPFGSLLKNLPIISWLIALFWLHPHKDRS